jgi:putative nucleotidyltransferase with HDIG domain
MSHQISLEQAITGMHDLPALPLVVHELIASFGREDISIGDLAAQVAQDQALTAKTLRLANSSFYGLQSKVRTIGQAIAVLGFDSIRALVTAAGVTGSFPATAPGGFDYDGFWRHAIGTALCTRGIARHVGGNPEFAFVTGLLHDLGRLLLVTRFPAQYDAVMGQRAATDSPLLEAERMVLGLDHAQVGRALAQHWKLPELICRAIAHHHAPLPGDFGDIPSMVHVANVLAHGLDLAGDEDELVPPIVQGAWDSLKLDPVALRAVFAGAEAEFEEACQILTA